ncbi:putative disease resistance RPP13-like protein 1-like protein [Corchorus olitorius]|uniref:Disease resistance RPP13-like protein 1-like protein n=1 Tax=Corchorus olitorius TaxID=93759 RepID=A0A1R3L479_9ROSI|nr:putative disease resistance RPP13-like protein 1-like protein [Corchorus olitorius]
MAGALVAEAFLSTTIQFLFDRLTSREVVDFIRGKTLVKALVNKLGPVLMSVKAVLNDAEDKQITNKHVKAKVSRFFSSRNPFNKGIMESKLEEFLETLQHLLDQTQHLGLRECRGGGETLPQRRL